MLRIICRRKSQATIEYVTVVFFIIIALIVFQKYFARGMYGRWKSIADSFGEGRVYDPQLTIECGYDRWARTNRWYNSVCFDSDCGMAACVNPASFDQTACEDCILLTCRSNLNSIDVCNN